MNPLGLFRKEKDEFFARDPDSPLGPADRSGFQGLRYFPENPALRLEIQVKEIPGEEVIEIPTSSGGTQRYRRLGRFSFDVESRPVELTIYENETGYFLPFVDSLAGQETYPAGRYIEPEPLGGGRFVVDFNLAYNPYCAYSDHWSCPLTPFENRLNVPIRAGEKIFHQ
ncbi:MAG: DUF1684 domain-containing protein [Chloroflexi bacterium]|nr:DUF1684 domain-containing protein [Chloroflexota bacterium]